MIISSIVAMNRDQIIGLNNQIPWYLPADLKFFKKITTGHHVLMGRKCFESIGNPLPNRTNIIITRDPFYIVSNCLIAHSIEEGILLAKKNGEKELFIIGGGEIYNQSKGLWNKLYITLVDYTGPGDTYFPEIELENWKLVSHEKGMVDAKNQLGHQFDIYQKI
ncbi:MAG: dihydrofolate reductase [Saprospiraceae bacterium]|nr:dihydrofolate reductase [Saprospiraceae bacterium]